MRYIMLAGMAIFITCLHIALVILGAVVLDHLTSLTFWQGIVFMMLLDEASNSALRSMKRANLV